MERKLGLKSIIFFYVAYDLALFAKKLSLEKDVLNYITRPRGHKWLSGEIFITEDGLNKRKQVINLIENKSSVEFTLTKTLFYNFCQYGI